MSEKERQRRGEMAMSELKAVHAFDVYEAYTKTGDDDAAQVYLKSEADKAIAQYQYKILVLEKSYKKLVKKLVHEASVAESYRSIIFKDDALNALEKDDVASYNILSKKSDNCYRHANRWRGIFRKMSQE